MAELGFIIIIIAALDYDDEAIKDVGEWRVVCLSFLGLF